MERENDILSSANSEEKSEYPQNDSSADSRDIPLIVPDDAFARDDSIEETPEEQEMLPQSLADEEDFPEEDDGLFTDEELASMKKNGSIFAQASPAEDFSPSFAPFSNSTESSCEDSDIAPGEGAAPVTRKIDSAFDLLEMFVFALAFVLLAMAFFFRHSVVDGGSMDKTLATGEHLIISDLFYSPKTGDIVVVQDASKSSPNPNLAKPIVKRVIATEGQHIQIFEDGRVEVDGIQLQEDYVYIDPFESDYEYEPLSMVVPDGCVFLMGDHRNVSLDSRSEAGAFREEAILGKVILRFLPLKNFGTVK